MYCINLSNITGGRGWMSPEAKISGELDPLGPHTVGTYGYVGAICSVDV